MGVSEQKEERGTHSARKKGVGWCCHSREGRATAIAVTGSQRSRGSAGGAQGATLNGEAL